MKRIKALQLCLILIFSFINFSFASEVDPKPPQNGHFVGHWPSGLKREEGDYRSGKKEGLWSRYETDGKNLSSQGFYHNGLREGKWAIWFQGVKRSEEQYENDVRSGRCVFFDPKGNKFREQNFKDGVPIGLCQEWYPDGKLKSEGSFIDGFRNGIWTTYYENGQKMLEGSFEKGEENAPPSVMKGHWTYWTVDGKSYDVSSLATNGATPLDVRIEDQQGCLFITVEARRKLSNGKFKSVNFEYIQRPEDKKALLFFRDSRSIDTVLDHDHHLIMVNEHSCSNCNGVLIHDLDKNTQWKIDTEAFKTYTDRISDWDGHGFPEGNSFSPDDKKVLINMAQDDSFVVETYTGHVLHEYRNTLAPQTWWNYQ